MGTWNYGNLDSDGAQDTLADICDELFARIAELLRDPHAHEFDDGELDELFVRIEMIFALNERKMITSAPDPNELRPLFAPFLQRWKDYYIESGCHPPEKRQQAMQETFDRMAEIAAGCPGDFAHRIGLISEEMSRRGSRQEND